MLKAKIKIVISEKNETPITAIKYFIKKILRRSRYNYKVSTNLNLDIDKKKTFVAKIKSKATLKKKIFIGTSNGFFYLENNKLYNIFENNQFYGIAKYKNKFFIACVGRHQSQGCIISFNYALNKIKNPKIEYKMRDQSFHDLKIHKGNLYLVNSTWRFALDEILKFKIGNNFLKLEEKIRPEINYPFIHLNTIFFKKNSILLCYHNMTRQTKMPSQVCEFKNDWKFLRVVKTENLASAHDVNITNKKFSILNSDNGIFLLGKDKFYFPGKFLRGFDHDKKNYYIGVNKIAQRHKRASMSPQLGMLDKKTKKTSTVLLPKIGAICSIKIVE